MTQRRSEHNPATDPPGAVSDQLPEEQPSGHREDGTHPEPRTNGTDPGTHERRGSRESRQAGEPGEQRDDSSGAAKEGSQATGHRLNAG